MPSSAKTSPPASNSVEAKANSRQRLGMARSPDRFWLILEGRRHRGIKILRVAAERGAGGLLGEPPRPQMRKAGLDAQAVRNGRPGEAALEVAADRAARRPRGVAPTRADPAVARRFEPIRTI